MTKDQIVIGDRAAEIRALQVLALAVSEAAGQLSATPPRTPRDAAVGPLLIAAGRALSLASCAGLDTPLEILALSARNSFELWLRISHVLANDANVQAWRGEALTDQLQVLDAILNLDGPEEAKRVIEAEIKRVRQHGTSCGLAEVKRPMMAGDLAKATGHTSEYDAFYRLYSKLVHPSSWVVNWPTAAASAMYSTALTVNAQVYAWRILEAVEDAYGIDGNQCYRAAVTRFGDESPVVH